MKTVLKPGISEMELAGMAETYARKFGHQDKIRTRHYQTEGYPWHILSGTNSARVGLLDAAASGKGTSAAFPVGAGNKKLSRGESIMVDMGLVLNGYHKVSFIGHGIGLEIVEPPFIAKNRKEPLEPGMTLALEPKMVYENEFAAGIESVFVVTATGSRLIARIPVEVFVC